MFGIKRIERKLDLLHQEMVNNREHTDRLFDEMALFQKEERLRANKVLEPLIATMNKLLEGHDRLIESHDDLVAEVRAQREGLWRIFEKFDPPEGRSGEAPA